MLQTRWLKIFFILYLHCYSALLVMLAHVVESQKKVWKDVRSSPSGDYLENLAPKWCDKDRHKIWELNLSNTNFIAIVSVSILFWRSKQRIKSNALRLVQML